MNFLNIRNAAALIGVAAAVTAPTAFAQSATYKIDPSHTFVQFEVKHLGTSTSRGRWDKKAAKLRLIAQPKPVRSTLRLIWHRLAPARLHLIITSGVLTFLMWPITQPHVLLVQALSSTVTKLQKSLAN